MGRRGATALQVAGDWVAFSRRALARSETACARGKLERGSPWSLDPPVGIRDGGRVVGRRACGVPFDIYVQRDQEQLVRRRYQCDDRPADDVQLFGVELICVEHIRVHFIDDWD